KRDRQSGPATGVLAEIGIRSITIQAAVPAIQSNPIATTWMRPNKFSHPPATTQMAKPQPAAKPGSIGRPALRRRSSNRPQPIRAGYQSRMKTSEGRTTRRIVMATCSPTVCPRFERIHLAQQEALERLLRLVADVGFVLANRSVQDHRMPQG